MLPEVHLLFRGWGRGLFVTEAETISFRRRSEL